MTAKSTLAHLTQVALKIFHKPKRLETFPQPEEIAIEFWRVKSERQPRVLWYVDLKPAEEDKM